MSPPVTVSRQGSDPEDDTLVRLARSAASRASGEGAAVRDVMGRTYLSGAVNVADLRLSAVEAAVAQAVGSGVTRLEAVAVIGTEEVPETLLVALGAPVVLRG